MKKPYTEEELQLAERLYNCYCEEVGGKAFNGLPLPPWSEFRADPDKQVQSDAWAGVARIATLILVP